MYCMWLPVWASALANNHLSKPDQRLSCRFKAGSLVGVRHAITRTPQTNRFHKFSLTNNLWCLNPYPKWNLFYLCRWKDTKEFFYTCHSQVQVSVVTVALPWWWRYCSKPSYEKAWFCFYFHHWKIWCVWKIIIFYRHCSWSRAANNLQWSEEKSRSITYRFVQVGLCSYSYQHACNTVIKHTTHQELNNTIPRVLPEL